VEVVTGNPQINRAFHIATTLVDDMRRKYHACGGLPISDGIPRVFPISKEQGRKKMKISNFTE
jgi:hypothetical protein